MMCVTQGGRAVIELVTAGQGYAACEKSVVVVRKLKRQGQLDEAMLFLMELAQLLGGRNMWEPAVCSARRAIDLFPPDAKTIRTVLKVHFIDFTSQVTVTAVGPDLFGYFSGVIRVFPNLKEELLARQARLCGEAGLWYRGFGFWVALLSIVQSPAVVAEVTASVARWTAAVDATELPFVAAKAVLAVASAHEDALPAAEALLASVGEVDHPVLNFARLFLRALSGKSTVTAGFLVDRYAGWLGADSDLARFVALARDVHGAAAPAPEPSGFGQLFQSIMGALTGGPP